jgi:predicted AlkP superfamily phosphohydrolase/phosphomutase
LTRTSERVLRARPGLLMLLILTGALAFAMGGCGEGRPDTKVVIIGIDGLEWQLVDPLLEEGKLPNLAGVIERGVRADLLSLEPEQKSPIVWTTIATGKGPQKHGITDYLDDTDEQPLINSLGWRARSVWDILGEKGYSVGVINWLVTWPAYEVNGYLVTDRIGYAPEDGHDPIPRVTHPDELVEELAPYRKPYSHTTDEEIAPFMDGDAWKSEHGTGTPEWNGAETVRTFYAQDHTALNVAKHLLESREQPDFLAVYVLGVDRCCHAFWGQMRPWTVNIHMSEQFIDTFDETILRYYEHMDEILGELLAALDEDSTVIVCSDHGFRGPHRTKEGTKLGIAMHRNVGVLAAEGPGIRRGVEGVDASVFDITPTVLELFGEPVGRDMDGFVLSSILEQEHLEENPVGYVDTYETGERGSSEPVESPVDEEIKEQLRSLGYIE